MCLVFSAATESVPPSVERWVMAEGVSLDRRLARYIQYYYEEWPVSRPRCCAAHSWAESAAVQDRQGL